MDEKDKNNENEENKNSEEKNKNIKNENFKEFYSKIELIKQKHKEHSEIDKNIHFSINDYKIDVLLNDNKLKEIFEMIEPNSNYKVQYKKSSEIFSSYNFKNENAKKFYENAISKKSNMNKFKDKEDGTTLNKIYDLFEEVNKLNNKNPIQKINYKKISYEPISKNYENKRIRLKTKKYFLNNSDIVKNNESISFLNSFKTKKNNNKNLNNRNNDFSFLKNKSITSLNSFRNKYNNYTNTLNMSNWFNNFSEKYNNKFYTNQLNKLSSAIDKAGNYPNKKKTIFYIRKDYLNNL